MGPERAALPASPLVGELGGVLAAYVVEAASGSVAGHTSARSGLDYELDAIQSSTILHAARAVTRAVAPEERLQSIVFVLGTQQHVLVPSRRFEGRFLYLVLERSAESLGLLLHRLATAGF